MLSRPLVIAAKELVDHARDIRSLASTALYTLMGPAVLWIVVFAMSNTPRPQNSGRPWPIMAAVFALVAAFSGGLSMAMDTIAGERERRSLVPLLLSSAPRLHILVGKWLAVSVFAAVGLLINLAAFAVVLPTSDTTSPWALFHVLSMGPALFSLTLLASSVEILISTMCRSVKEANSYLSMLVFATMGVGMWLAFRPQAASGWWYFVPIAGQQRLLELGFARETSSFVQSALVAFHSTILASVTAASALLVLIAAWRLFERDDAVYGG